MSFPSAMQLNANSSTFFIFLCYLIHFDLFVPFLLCFDIFIPKLVSCFVLSLGVTVAEGLGRSDREEGPRIRSGSTLSVCFLPR